MRGSKAWAKKKLLTYTSIRVGKEGRSTLAPSEKFMEEKNGGQNGTPLTK